MLSDILKHIKEDEILMVPSTDEFLLEYSPIKRLAKVTGVDMSFGFAFIGHNHKIILTDSRYIKEVQIYAKDFDVHIFNKNSIAALPKLNYVVDGNTISTKMYKLYSEYHALRFSKYNIIDLIFSIEPYKPTNYYHLDNHYCGEESKSKVANVCSKMKADAIFISASDAINWLLNIRGDDVPYCGMHLCYLSVSKNGDYKFLYTKEEVESHFLAMRQNNMKIELDLDNTPASYTQKFQDIIINQPNIINQKKAIKNAVEIDGFKQSHILDAVALLELFHYLEDHYHLMTEYDVANKLLELKTSLPNFLYPSFATIAAYGPNGAIIHYKPNCQNALKLANDNLFLLDSGSHFANGTTDVTRGLHFGAPTLEQKQYYTAVLKGLLGIMNLQVPKNTKACVIDGIARQYLWQLNCDYGHGTGHGIGCHLSVHESPPNISPNNTEVLSPGMVTSIEPGVYLENFGIRLENAFVINASSTDKLIFETLTLVPFEPHLLDFSVLSELEVRKIFNYHKHILQTLSPYLNIKIINWYEQKYLLR